MAMLNDIILEHPLHSEASVMTEQKKNRKLRLLMVLPGRDDSAGQSGSMKQSCHSLKSRSALFALNTLSTVKQSQRSGLLARLSRGRGLSATDLMTVGIW